MKKYFLFFIFLLYFLIQPASNAWYYDREAVREVFTPDTIHDTAIENLYILEKNNKFGIYNSDKNFFTDYEFENCIHSPEDLYTFIVQKNGKKGVYNADNNITSNIEYDDVTFLSNTNGVFEVTKDEKKGILYTDSYNIPKVIYDRVGIFKNYYDYELRNDEYVKVGSNNPSSYVYEIKNGEYTIITDIDKKQELCKIEGAMDDFEITDYYKWGVVFKKDNKYGWYDTNLRKIYNVKADYPPYPDKTPWFTPLTATQAIRYYKNGFTHSSKDNELIPKRILLLPIEIPGAVIHDTGNILQVFFTAGLIFIYKGLCGEHFNWWIARQAY